MKLSKREYLIITQPNKGESIVIKDNVSKKCNDLFNNEEFYYGLGTDPFDHQDTLINSSNDMIGKI